jgi:hypothetical protein
MANRASLRRDVLAAYRSLADGDAEPLVALLDPDAEWIDAGATTVYGRAAVESLLRAQVERGIEVVLQGVTLSEDEIVLEFSSPWWRRKHRVLDAAIMRALGWAPSQTVTLGRSIARIVCMDSPHARFDDRSRNELFGSLLTR